MMESGAGLSPHDGTGDIACERTPESSCWNINIAMSSFCIAQPIDPDILRACMVRSDDRQERLYTISSLARGALG